MREHEAQARDQRSCLGTLCAAMKRVLRVVFPQRTPPANSVSRHLTPEEIAAFEAQMEAHYAEERTPSLKRSRP